MANVTLQNLQTGSTLVIDNSLMLQYLTSGAWVIKYDVASSISPISAAAGANAGASPPAPVISGTNDHGNITFGTGTAPAAGAQVAVTFGPALASAPAVELTPANDVTEVLGLEVTAISATGFTVSTHGAPAASQANTVYALEYTVD